VTCGGLCPGLNNVIRGLVLQLSRGYGIEHVMGFRYGYEGLVRRHGHAPVQLTPSTVGDIHHEGGSSLGTSRGPQDAVEKGREQASQHAEQARREQEAGRFGTAATLFRLAFEQDPTDAYETGWREALAIARRQRAEVNFTKAQEARKSGRPQDAARLFAEAADADPTLRNLSEAAAAMAEVDAPRARELAMSALEGLQQAQARKVALDDRTVAGVHQACARAFLSAGQIASAKEQAERAHALAPSNQTRTLLNSIKLT
jgi:tetratricopeptide (TPR) repeat protein